MPRWTPEARKKQSELICLVRPWEKSTEPQTLEGKAISSKNRGSYSRAYFPEYALVRVGYRQYKRLRKERDRLLKKMWTKSYFTYSI